MLFGQGLRLLLGEAALRQALDEAVGVEGDGLGHAPIIGSPPVRDKDHRAGRPDESFVHAPFTYGCHLRVDCAIPFCFNYRLRTRSSRAVEGQAL